MTKRHKTLKCCQKEFCIRSQFSLHIQIQKITKYMAAGKIITQKSVKMRVMPKKRMFSPKFYPNQVFLEPEPLNTLFCNFWRHLFYSASTHSCIFYKDIICASVTFENFDYGIINHYAAFRWFEWIIISLLPRSRWGYSRHIQVWQCL